jgi:hypothetical protein
VWADRLLPFSGGVVAEAVKCSLLIMWSLAESCDILNRFSRQFFHNLATARDTGDSLRISRQLATPLRQSCDTSYIVSLFSSNKPISTVAGGAFGNNGLLADQLSQIALDIPDVLAERFL